MKPFDRILAGLVALALLASGGCASRSPADAPEDLLAEGLDGWECYLSEPGATQSDVWAFVDGVLICSGSPPGYLYTRGPEPGAYDQYKAVSHGSVAVVPFRDGGGLVTLLLGL